MAKAKTAAKAKKPTRRASKPAPAAPEPTKIIGYKGFDKDLRCRGFQFEVGKTYKHKGAVKACASGFHACENPMDVMGYYMPGIDGNRVGTIESIGPIARQEGGDSKFATARLTVTAELTCPAFIKAAVDWMVAQYKAAATTGARSAAATTGYGSAAATTGARSAAATTGYGSAAATTGYGSAAATTGARSAAATTGDGSAAATTGDGSAAATTGYGSAAATTGVHSIAAALGKDSVASAGVGGWLVCSYWGKDWHLVNVRAAKVGTEGIEAGKKYRLDAAGNFVEVAP